MVTKKEVVKSEPVIEPPMIDEEEVGTEETFGGMLILFGGALVSVMTALLMALSDISWIICVMVGIVLIYTTTKLYDYLFNSSETY